MIARVVVVPKPVVNDPQGMTVRQGLRALGFAEVADVRIGRYIEVHLDGEDPEEGRRRVEEMCRRLLANQVIEDYRFELSAPSPPAGEGRGGGPERASTMQPGGAP
jgi:phosphoribosylformylglycinamidine synthase PurS subunit